MEELAAVIEAHLELHGLAYRKEELLGEDPRTLFLSDFHNSVGKWVLAVEVFEAQRVVRCRSVPVMTCPETRRAELSFFLTDANFGLLLGNWELDRERGNFGFKASIAVADGEITDKQVGQLIGIGVMITPCYLPGIRAVVEAGASSSAAIAMCEKTQTTH